MTYRNLLRTLLPITYLLSCTGTVLEHRLPAAGTDVLPHPGSIRQLTLDGDIGPRRHELPFDLEAPTYLLVLLDQKGIDARLTLRDADGRPLASSRGAAGGWTEETLVVLTPSAGRHMLEVALEPGESGRGEVVLSVIDRHPGGADDARRLEIERRRSGVLDDLAQQRIDAATAAGILREAAREIGELGDVRRRSDLMFDAAGALTAARLFTEAEEAYRTAAALRDRLGDAAGAARALEAVVRLQLLEERTQDALETVTKAKRSASDSGDPLTMALIDNVRGSVLRRNGENEAALAAFHDAVDGFRRGGDRVNEAFSLVNLGGLLRRLGRNGCAEVGEAARLLRELRFESAGVLLNHGLCQRERGLGDAAFESYERALDIAERESDEHAQGQALVHLGALLAEYGVNDQAARELRRSLKLLHPKAARFITMAHVNLGWIALGEERPEDGEQEFLRALSGGGADAEVLRGLGAALAAQGRHEEALHKLEQALAAARGRSDARSEGEALRKLGALQMRMGRLEEARASLTASLSIGLGRSAIEGAARSDLARVEARRGDDDAALAHLRRAMEIRESLRGSVSSAEVRATYLSRWRDDFSLLLDLLQRAGRPAHELLEVSERAHARTLQELLVEARRGRTGEPPPELLREQQEWQGRLETLIRRQTEPSSQEELAELERQIDLVVDELKKLDWRLSALTETPAEASPLGLGDIQARLADGEALLEYALGEERSYLFLVRRDGLTVHSDLPPASEIAALVERLLPPLRTPHNARLPQLLRDAHRLYNVLLAPAAAELVDIDSLLVVPDRELFYLPFEVLVRQDPAGGRNRELPYAYAMQRWQISYVPAATVLGRLGNGVAAGDGGSDRGGTTLVAFADSQGGGTEAAASLTSRRSAADYGPLPKAREEVAAIASLLPPGNSRLFVGADATLPALRAQAEARWLHFAVHGFFVPRHPSLSGLVLADGELRTRDIYDLRLDAELVVLSACETGLGEQVWGEELIGLSRAFFYAGVPTAVVSLWRVSDRSTADLMIDFYRRLLAGAGPAEALTEAKRRLLADGREHPFYWAPFVVIGQPRFAP